MGAMLKIGFKGDWYGWLEAFRQKGPQIVQVLTTKVNLLMVQLGAFVQTEKLSGQVLTPRTGVLRGSVHVAPARFEGKKIIGAVEAAGGPAFYGVYQEEGGKAPYTIAAVRKRSLSFVLEGKQRFFDHVVRSPLKQRAFMRPSLEENAEKIADELQASVNRVVSEK
jgi:hypothetical protein